MAKINVNKEGVLTGLGFLFTVGGLVVNVLSKNDEQNKIAEKAAEIAAEKLSKKES